MLSLKGMTWDHRRATEPLVALDSAFTACRPDVSVSWNARPLAGFEFDSIERLAAENDLIIFDHPFCGRIAATRCFLSVTELLNDAGGDRAFVGPSMASYDVGDGHWGVPVDAACQVAVYRPDLLERLGGTVPQTWDQACALGERARRQGLSLAIGLKGVHSLMTFFSLCASMGSPYADETSSAVDESAAREALAQMRRLVALCKAPVFDLNSIALHDVLAASGDLVYCPAVYGFAAYGEADGANAVAFGPFAGMDGERPGSGSTIGGAGLGLSARLAAQPELLDAALDYARLAASGSAQRDVFATHHGQPAHVDAWSDAAIDERFNGFFSATQETMERSWIRPRHDGYLKFQEHGGELIEAHLRGDLAEHTLFARLKALHTNSMKR